MPPLPEVEPEKAEVAWFLYDLKLCNKTNRFELKRYKTIYTAFEPALLRITKTPAGKMSDFVSVLQSKLDDHLTSPDAPALQDMMSGRRSDD